VVLRFQINAPGVVAEVIDGEAVIMNLASGHYFSAQGVGAWVWQQLEAGTPVHDVVDTLTTHFAAPPATIQPAIDTFVAALLEHDLLVERRDDTGAPSAVVTSELPAEWRAPSLGVFTDMEDLLLLDPIHDVSEAGWPMPKADGPAA
jgi:hypothetical protein